MKSITVTANEEVLDAVMDFIDKNGLVALVRI